MSDVYAGIPKSLKVGCYRFAVEIGESADHESEGSFGHMNPVSQKIRLRPGMTAQNLANTFIHEVIHALNWFSGAGTGLLTEDSEPLYGRVEEDFTTKIANSMCAFAQDNPGAMLWWMGTNDCENFDLREVEEAALVPPKAVPAKPRGKPLARGRVSKARK